jgi:predicted alpha/beta superfamily hydrolase
MFSFPRVLRAYTLGSRVTCFGLAGVFAGISCAKPPALSAPAAPSGAASTAVAGEEHPAPRSSTNESDPVARIGAKYRYSSAILKEERDYWIDLPDGYDSAGAAQMKYPVLYLLDAERFFAQASTIVKFMSGLGTIPEMIVVGIPSTAHRTRDMTPTHSLTGPNGESRQRGAKSGGGDVFLSSLQTELFPLIEGKHRAMPYRILVGHSLTGLFVLHAFLTDPSSFQAIVAMDPALWWDDHLLAKRAAAGLSNLKNPRNSVYIGAAHHDEADRGLGPKAATQAFYRAIHALSSPTFRSKLQTFDEEHHGSVPLPSFYDGLRFIFDGYALIPPSAVQRPADILAHYRQYSEKHGATFEPPEMAFAVAAFDLLFERKKVTEAIAVLEENAKRYPSSPRAHDYLGQAYLAKGDKPAALRCFQRVLELDPGDQEAVKQLENARAK